MELESITKSDYLVNCTWTIESGCQDMKNVVKFSSKPSYTLDDVVQVESCVHLSVSEPNRVPCKINIKLSDNSPYLITRVDLFSEARVIECYGSCEEYISTTHGEHMDDFEGSTIYSASFKTPPSKEITLKFARIKPIDQLWIYGLMFTVEKVTPPQMKVAGINLLNVNDILKESNRPISEKAESCIKLIQQCGNSIDYNGSIDPKILVRMFEDDNPKSLGDSSRRMSKCMMRIIPFMMSKAENASLSGSDNFSLEELKTKLLDSLNLDKIEICNNHSNKNHVNDLVNQNEYINNNNNNNNSLNVNTNPDFVVNQMKEYVDKRMNDIENNLINRLEQRIKDIEIAQSNKFDAILKLLENK